MRTLVISVFSAFLALGFLAPSQAAATERLPEARLGDDGLHKQTWFKESFLDLAEDLEEARAEGKRLVVFFEQAGCGYCRRMHQINLRQPQVVDFIKKHFHVVQLDLKGAREVTDFDGEALTEKSYAAKLFMRGTPKIVFFHDDPAEVDGKGGLDAVTWQYEGYFPPEHYFRTFEYIATKGYEGAGQPDFMKWLEGPAAKADFTLAAN